MSDRSFSEEVQELNAFRAFARSLPWICAQSGEGVSFLFKGHPHGVEINLAMTGGGSDALAIQVLDRLKKTERLLWLEALIPEFLRVGAPASEIDILMEEAERLAQELHPEDVPPPDEP